MKEVHESKETSIYFLSTWHETWQQCAERSRKGAPDTAQPDLTPPFTPLIPNSLLLSHWSHTQFFSSALPSPSHLTQPSLCLKHESPCNNVLLSDGIELISPWHRAKKLNSQCCERREKHLVWERSSLVQCHLDHTQPPYLFAAFLIFTGGKKKNGLVTSWAFLSPCSSLMM